MKDCGWCQNEFHGRPLAPESVEVLRRVLLVKEHAYDPIICETCFATVTNNAPRMEIKNFLLRA